MTYTYIYAFSRRFYPKTYITMVLFFQTQRLVHDILIQTHFSTFLFIRINVGVCVTHRGSLSSGGTFP